MRFKNLMLSVLLGVFALGQTAFGDETNPHFLAWRDMNVKALELLQEGQVDEAKTTALKALDYAMQHLGEDDLSIPKTLNNIGVLYFSGGDRAKAEDYIKQAMDNVKKFHGERHPYIADSLINLAKLDLVESNFAGALVSLEDALQIMENHFGDSAKELVLVLEMLMKVYAQVGLREEALDTRMRMVHIMRGTPKAA